MRTSYIIWIAEDWDNEEYTGSLADSKVFTPSSGPEPSQQPVPENAVDGAMPLLDQSQPLTLDMQPPSRPPQMPPVSHVSLLYRTLDLVIVQFIFSAKESKSNDGRRIWNPRWINFVMTSTFVISFARRHQDYCQFVYLFTIVTSNNYFGFLPVLQHCS